MTERPVAVDVFCGAGGLSQGLQDAGFNILIGVDNDERAVETFERNLNSPGICRDIQTIELGHPQTSTEGAEHVDSQSVTDIVAPSNEIDLVVGGPPCPTFSRVGRSKIQSLNNESPEEDERHELYQDFLRFVDYYWPTAFVMENVQGIVNAENDHGESVSDIIIDEMADLGYQTSVMVVDAADFGVPQHRKRAFFIGVRNGYHLPDLEQWRTHRKPVHPSEKEFQTLWGERPSSQAAQATLTDFGVDDETEYTNIIKGIHNRQPWITVAEAILDLPPVSPDGDIPPKKVTEYRLDPLTEFQEWARDVDTGSKEHPLQNHESRGHNMLDLSLYKLLGEGVGWNIGDIGQHLQPYREDIFSDKYKKQNPREPASTIVAHLSRDGHMFIHPREARSLTVREAARLQSFRDSFVFPKEYTVAFRLVGNAVPPRLAEVIGQMLRKDVLER
jgi:DNA (cytosine-5)-methyltransferase 1